MKRIKNFRLATQGITAVLLFGIAFAACGAEQMMRALPAPAAAQPVAALPAVQQIAAPAAARPAPPMSQMKLLPQASTPAAVKQLPQANAPAVMQPANSILPPLAPLNLEIQEVNQTISKLKWDYPDGNLQRKLTGIEWSLCTGPGDNCMLKTKAVPPQININDKTLGTFLGFPFEKVKIGSAITAVKMCYINALGSGCARIDVPKPPPSAVVALNKGAINTAVVAVPMTVNFGSVFSGDSRSTIVRVVSPRDGKVTVALAPNSPFSIADVKVYGMAETKSGGATSNQVLKKSPAPQQLKAAGPSAAPTLMTNFSGSLLATITSPPFNVSTQEGNEVVVTLVFAPKFDLFNGLPVGDHNTTLALDGGMWKTSVPVSGRFEGLKIGIIAVMSNPDVTVFTGTTGVLPDVELVLINTDKQAVTVLYSAKHLPPGFALAQMNVQIPAGQTIKVKLPVIANSAMHEGAQQTAELTVSYSGTVKTVPFTFSVYPAEKKFSYSGADGLEWELTLILSPSGTTQIYGKITNPNFIVDRDAWFDIQWKGMYLAPKTNYYINNKTMGGSNRNFEPIANVYQVNVVRDNYTQMLQTPPTVMMHYRNH